MTAEFRAGLFVLVSLSVLFYMASRLTQNRYSFAGTKSYYAKISDATGLLSKTKVKMAGLDVGQLTEMDLAGKNARIRVEIASDMVLHQDATLAVKAIGFLGDKYLELFAGSDAKPVLEEGAYLLEGTATGSLDQLTAKTTELVENLKEVASILKEALKGAGQDGDEQGTRLARILENMESFSQSLSEMDKLGDLSERLNDIAGNLRDVSKRINRGEGTVGKLLNDTETIDKLNQALSGVNKIVNKAEKLQVQVDARNAALTTIGGTRGQYSLMIQPTYDKYYLFGVSTRPQGVSTVTKTFTTPNVDSPGSTTSVERKEVNEETAVGFNFQFAKRFSDFFVRLGLFESTGGLGLDYQFLDDRAKLTAELYRFKRGESPQLNVGAELHVYRPFFVWGGADYLMSHDNRSLFIGGGLRFSDQDIKSLITAVAAAR